MCMSLPNVLLIDACDARRYAVRLELKSLGTEVRQAQSVEQAQALVRERRPDLIVCAPLLPGMNAFDLLELLRMRFGADAAPIVIHCQEDTWPLANAALQRGALAVTDAGALREGLAAWLRAGSAKAPSAVAPAADAPPARLLRPTGNIGDGALRTPAGAGPPGAPAQRGALTLHCFAPVLISVLVGLLLGLWIAAMLAP
jgi:CheY-like chemotaxis protein